MGTCIVIVDWAKHYENNRTRELRRMAWVPMPNRMDGDGYTELLDHVNGSAHFGAWCALVEVASRCDVRGTLMRDARTPHDIASLARITRIPASVWTDALPRLVSIGWITYCEIPQEGAVLPQEGATIPQVPAPAPHPTAIERNGTEGKGKSGGADPDTSPQGPAEHTDALPYASPPSEDAAAAFQSRLKSSLAKAGIALADSDVQGISARLIASAQIGIDGDVAGFIAWACARAKREAKTSAPGTYLVLCLQRYSTDWLSRWEEERTAAKKRDEGKCPECGSKTGHLYTCSQSLSARAEREEQAKLARASPPAISAEQAPDTFPDDIPEPAGKAALDIF